MHTDNSRHGHSLIRNHQHSERDSSELDLTNFLEKDDDEESSALEDVIAACLFYKTYTLNTGIYRRLKHIDDLSARHRDMVSSLGTIDKIKEAERLVRENQKFLQKLVYASSVGSTPDSENDQEAFRQWHKAFFEFRKASGRPPVVEHHMEKVYSTLKQFVRDWANEGKEEREQTYGPLLEALESEFAHVQPNQRGKLRVLVPGAGLGRLAYEICCRGFSSQGNEFSYFMLFASNFILNKSLVTNQHTIYPFVHQFSNVVCANDQMRKITVPDVLPSSLPFAESAEFSMTAGDFIEIYSAEDEKERWDAIVTCFFMDTAKNVLDYLDTMWSAMKPGAVWINLGPLLWHFDNVANESSIELTRDEFIELVKKVGFELDEKHFADCVSVSYTANDRSMLQYTYRAFMCVARKPHTKD
ncbi:hypothetical protein LPJ64_005272 [Coemansia asiatica]|uniref:carnosine N-methyltransferase n=1 Tax=Coemansia asiatica TaxID=1052880 RepID=A0A9W7XHH4_9FUNG|nr:hypothetical protein LPJ64_005272 [Coemansia asiatica]